MLVDIHCHILPQIDDGAKNNHDCIDMCKQAVENGYTDIIATPHHLKGVYNNPGEFVQEKVNQVNQILVKEGIRLNIHAGQEVRIHEDLIQHLQRNEVLTLAGSKYVLIELPSCSVPLYTKNLFFNLQNGGYIPVIAHPERNKVFQKHPNKLIELVQHGALTQLTWQSLHWRSPLRKFSKKFISNESVHFVATDAHNCENRSINSLTIKKSIHSASLKKQIMNFEQAAEALILSGRN